MDYCKVVNDSNVLEILNKTLVSLKRKIKDFDLGYWSKYEECNQDNIFNDVIAIVSKLETSKTLSYPDILEINKFLRLARHTKVLDIRDYLIDNKV